MSHKLVYMRIGSHSYKHQRDSCGYICFAFICFFCTSYNIGFVGFVRFLSITPNNFQGEI